MKRNRGKWGLESASNLVLFEDTPFCPLVWLGSLTMVPPLDSIPHGRHDGGAEEYKRSCVLYSRRIPVVFQSYSSRCSRRNGHWCALVDIEKVPAATRTTLLRH